MGNSSSHICEFCKKSFSNERTLINHVCVKKRRWMDRNEAGPRMGMYIFFRFYEKTSTSKKQKTVTDFINSRYYKEFVKFGRYLHDLNPIQPTKFIDYVIDNSIKIDDWTKEYVYFNFLDDIINKEPVEHAVERSLVTIIEWCDFKNVDYSDFFSKIGPNEATFFIRSGKLSPWVLYLSKTNDKLWCRFTQENLQIIRRIVNPAKWEIKFKMRADDVDYVINILEEAGI